MSSEAMMPRHWKQIMDLTEHRFDVESETFKLRNIMEAPLLRYKEEIEVLGRKKNRYMNQTICLFVRVPCFVTLNI